MCGIAGIISPNPLFVTYARLEKMAEVLAHRGPDGEGFWINSTQSVGFAHRRLAIIDLSDEAAQPMHYPTGVYMDELQRYTITYNGEIYNFPEIRTQLLSLGYHFHTYSDTEVILAAYDCYREECLQYLDGMFAFALWDEKTQTLFAARDRFGEKPFYYTLDESDGTLLFGSEMKALWAVGINKQVDEEALLYYIGLGITRFPVENHRSFYRNIFSLLPAHYMKWQPSGMKMKIQRYWDVDRSRISKCTDGEATESLRHLLTTSVNRRLRSDVPLGGSLSGGLDSSSIAAIAHKLLPNDSEYKSFSAVFPGYEKDESSFIKQLVSSLGYSNFAVSPDHKDLLDSLEKICFHHELPIGSASVFTQYAVCQLAGKHSTKVLLDGQGADEVLGGYTKYIHWWLQELLGQRRLSEFKFEKNKLAENQIPFEWDTKNYFAAFAPGLAALMLQQRERRKLSANKEIHPAFLHAFINHSGFEKPYIAGLNDALYYNTMQHGLEELLSYADRNSMSQGIELRLPFLSHELVSFLFTLPGNFKIRNGYTKWILRETMKAELPATIAWRKDKTGFEPPQKSWMEQPSFQERIHEAKRQLVTLGILSGEVLQMPVRPQSAFAPENKDWRYLIAATLLYQR